MNIRVYHVCVVIYLYQVKVIHNRTKKTLFTVYSWHITHDFLKVISIGTCSDICMYPHCSCLLSNISWLLTIHVYHFSTCFLNQKSTPSLPMLVAPILVGEMSLVITPLWDDCSPHMRWSNPHVLAADHPCHVLLIIPACVCTC